MKLIVKKIIKLFVIKPLIFILVSIKQNKAYRDTNIHSLLWASAIIEQDLAKALNSEEISAAALIQQRMSPLRIPLCFGRLRIALFPLMIQLTH